MTDQKTEQEIKRCLQLCSSCDVDACTECSYTTPEKGMATCSDLLMRDALRLINKREQEIVDLMDKQAQQLLRIAEGINNKCQSG